MKHLCLVIERCTGTEIDSFIVEDADDLYFARHHARLMFEEKLKYTPSLRKSVSDWCVDSCEIED